MCARILQGAGYDLIRDPEQMNLALKTFRLYNRQGPVLAIMYSKKRTRLSYIMLRISKYSLSELANFSIEPDRNALHVYMEKLKNAPSLTDDDTSDLFWKNNI